MLREVGEVARSEIGVSRDLTSLCGELTLEAEQNSHVVITIQLRLATVDL